MALRLNSGRIVLILALLIWGTGYALDHFGHEAWGLALMIVGFLGGGTVLGWIALFGRDAYARQVGSERTAAWLQGGAALGAPLATTGNPLYDLAGPRPHDPVGKRLKWTVGVTFEVPDQVPPRLMRAATKRGLKAATRRMPPHGRVRATGGLRDVAGPTTRVAVKLVAEGPGLSRNAADEAGDAFGDAFLRRLRWGRVEARRLQ